MSYERTTRQCHFSELDHGIQQALQGYFQSHGLGDPETESRLCTETLTVRRPAPKWISILEGNLDPTSRLAMMITSDWLVWVLSGERSGTVTAGARLKVLKTKILVTRRSEEFRLEISGLLNDSKEFARGTFELGAQPAAQKFCESVNTAVLEQNPPPSKEHRRWFGI